ncbi:MAG: aspartate carbamoyltransferase catalytic subunit [Actinobacteria bacterium]|nr:aspartate carbamoyltransferase catalytic subunit [Actinomycetota bacterium]
MAQLQSKDLLGITDLTREEIELILDTADSFKEISERPIKKVPTLRGRTIVNLFCEPSTRTRTSFEIAAKRLSADAVNISVTASAIAKGESLRDTAKTLQAMATDLVVIRHSVSGAAKLLADVMDCPVVNAGDGAHEHPTQALLDLYTMRERFDSLDGLKVAIVGDIAHSRVARSNILALGKMGAEVTLVGPPTLMPAEIEKLGAQVCHRLDDVLSEADVVYVLRIQLERQKESLYPSIREYATLYGLNTRRRQAMKKGSIILHPGPMNRGVEISSDVADAPDSLITDQVTSGVAVRMAVLYLLIGGGSDG